MLDVLGIRNAQKLIPLQEDQKPKDPITENMDVLKNKPLKAFIYQDHEAHLTAHMNFMSDPLTMKTIGQNPQAQMMAAALQAHMAEHFGFKYRQLIEQQLGAPLPYLKEDDDTIPEDYEVQISRLIAQASSQLLQQNQAQAAQQQAQQQAQDPIIQMQQQELQIKAQDVQRKAQTDQADVQLKQEQINVERERISAQLELESTKAGIKMSSEKDKLSSQNQLEGMKIGVDIAKSRELGGRK
jgi:hypothetical protein